MAGRTWEPKRMPINRGEGLPMWLMCAMEFPLAVWQNQVRIFADKRRKLEVILLSNIITQKEKYHTVPLIH